MGKSIITKKAQEMKPYADPLFACLRQSEAIELCQALAAKHNGDPAKIEAEFRKSSLCDAETVRATIHAGIDAWFHDCSCSNGRKNAIVPQE